MSESAQASLPAADDYTKLVGDFGLTEFPVLLRNGKRCVLPSLGTVKAFVNDSEGRCVRYQIDGIWHDNTDPKTLSSCKARFANHGPLPSGPFPGYPRKPWITSAEPSVT